MPKALLVTSDPYEPSGVIGLFDTDEQKQAILTGYREQLKMEEDRFLESWTSRDQEDEDRKQRYIKDSPKHIERWVAALTEIEIPMGVFGNFY
jgi:hypothetical protein